MSDEQHRNRDEWAQLTQSDYFGPPQQQTYVPEGYAAAERYAPAGVQNGYSDYQDSVTSPNGTSQAQGMSLCTTDDDDIPEEEVRDFASSRRQEHKFKGQANPKEEQPKSKRAVRREKIANEHQGEVSATDKPKGLVEWRNGVFQWWDPQDNEWRKAAYHDQYRDQFILEDNAVGAYLVSPACGKGANDITSACSAFNQLEWRLPDRDNWDNIVDANGNKVLYLLDRPVDQSYDEPERLWIHDDCVLLDGDNNPVRPWTGIPRCFSSKIEGGRMEALRRILPMTIQDFRARMPRAVPTGAGIGAGTKPLSYPSTFGHRSSRFRAQYQCPAWIPRAASAILKRQVLDMLPEPQEATSTEGLQVLSRYEMERRKSSTRGTHLYKANGHAISEEERKERDRKAGEKLKRQAARQPKTPQRPPRMPATPCQSASPSVYLPTPSLSASNKRIREDDGLGGLDAGQSKLAAKRGRLDTSPLDSRVQAPFSAFGTFYEDPYQQIPNAYDAWDTVSTNDPHHGLSGPNTNEIGQDFGGTSIKPQNLALGQNTGVPAIPPQQLGAFNIERMASTNDSQNDVFQLDYRFVHPQNPLEQMRIQAALFYPRAHYHALIGEQPPHTSEGTYAEQYLQISALLAQNWMVGGELPLLADIGPWNGSFNTVPTPDLPDWLLEIMLSPTAGTTPATQASTTDHHAQGSFVGFGAEDVQTIPNSNTGPQHDRDSSDPSEDLFGEYVENANMGEY